MKYNQFIKSDKRKNKRKTVLDIKGKQCQKCGIEKNLNVHHSHYKARYGNEKTKSLYVLCVDCHKEFHDIYGVSDDMITATRAYLGLKQSYIYLEQGLIDHIKAGGKYGGQNYTKHMKTWRGALKYAKDPEKHKDRYNIIGTIS